MTIHNQAALFHAANRTADLEGPTFTLTRRTESNSRDIDTYPLRRYPFHLGAKDGSMNGVPISGQMALEAIKQDSGDWWKVTCESCPDHPKSPAQDCYVCNQIHG